MSNGKVSIIVPAYNAEKWIGETLSSALAQTWADKEIIVVDDGSTDSTLEIAKGFESKIVKVISQRNGGASAARNRGLREAQGEFVQYLDADDLLSPAKIEEQVNLLRDNAIGKLAVSGTIHFFDGDKPANGIAADDWLLVDSDDPLNWLIELFGPDGRGGMVHPAAWLVPRTVADAAGWWNEQLSLDDDGEYFARVVLASGGIRCSGKEVSYYRKFRNGNNLSASRSQTHLMSALRAIELKEQYLLARTNDRRAKRALARIYSELAVQSYPEHPKVTDAALLRVKDLGGSSHFPCGGPRLEFIKSLFGWKFARRTSFWYHRYIASFIKS